MIARFSENRTIESLNRTQPNGHNMPASKVNRNYPVTIPRDVHRRAVVDRGDTVMVEYDADEETILVTPPKRGKRKIWMLGKKLGIAEIQTAI
jgi:bifunctional DNA-binding transcriptional regulator/antitoxin component of YhaV-PrlF toxin-antitoxin module